MQDSHQIGFSKAETSAINLIEKRVLPALEWQQDKKDWNPWLDILSHAFADGYEARDLELQKIKELL